MATDIQFWDGVAEKYARQPISDVETYEKKLALTWEHLPGDARILEFGSGTGATALLHAEKVGEVLATDISPGMIAIANRRLAETSLTNVRFEAATIFDIQEPESFDAVLGLNVLHLMPDWKPALAHAHSLLKPGGLLITSTPMLDRWFLKLLIPTLRFFGKAPEVVYFSADEYEEALSSAGYEEIARLQPKKSLSALFQILRKV